ncbi:sensor histidine kinase [Streptomyces sp. NPDC048845]|uniref:sensor histidine kinase n=1 Tax=Streptomyces sp. NPDC048845 TaxID=3155390 RepID=UPI00342680BE
MSAVTAVTSAEQRWKQFHRWGPYALLGISGSLSALTAEEITTPREGTVLLALFAVALVWHGAWTARDLRLQRSGRPGRAWPGAVHFAGRLALAFAMTWLNPFCAIYALLTYFDADRLVLPFWARAGAFVTAVTMAGSQSGGLPPAHTGNWIAFGALFALHISLVLVFEHIGNKESQINRERVDTIDKLERANARLEQALTENAGLHAQLLVQAREAGIADERARLAAEIHDTIAQGLAGIVTQLQAALDSPDPDAARQRAERAAELARRSLREARRSVQNLGPGALEHAPLPEALKETLSTAAAPGDGAPTSQLVVTGTVEPLHDEVEATLLRIAQEALANVTKHAAATRVGVTLSYMGDEVTLDIRDDGRGFDPDAVASRRTGGTSGFGLTGMRARAERLAGTVAIESAPGQGTAVSARVPLIRHD